MPHRPSRIPTRIGGIAAVLLVLVLATPGVAWAGGGAETTLVVVNADSPGSLVVANLYVELREIPATHVLYLHDVPAQPVVDIATFRTGILAPIHAYLDAQGLTDRVDLIAYSTGFPYGVNFDADTKAKEIRVSPPISRIASLTGLTYLYRKVLAEDPAAYLSMHANSYYRRDRGFQPVPTRRMKPPERVLLTDAQGAMRSKDWDRAAEALTKLTASFPEFFGGWYDLACCHCLLGRNDEALDALEKAVENGWRNPTHTQRDIDLEPLRDLPAFARLLEAMRGGSDTESTLAFDVTRDWSGKEPAEGEESLERYRMAVMLGWTGAHGNTTEEVLACLRRAHAADGTQPEGTVYFMVNDNVRAKTRAPVFEGAAAALKRLGRKAEILTKGQDGQDGVLPRDRSDMLGIVAGIASFRWGDLPELLPGSIAEHLTSFGAHFGTPGQTKCTEFIRHGAAGSSGTVAEPYALFDKFPSPHMHSHYALGCSLAEAYYQSVWGPYQLLILGDPLCRPFARFATVRIDGPDPAEPWTGTVDVTSTVDTPAGGGLARLELWVDGAFVTEAEPGAPLPWDTTTTSDGVHDVRVVAIAAGPVATRSHARADVRVANGAMTIAVQPVGEPVGWGADLELAGTAEGVTDVAILRGLEVLTLVPVRSRSWKAALDTRALGLGRVTLHAQGVAGDGNLVRSAPVVIDVSPTADLAPAVVLLDLERRPGLRATFTAADDREVEGVVVGLGTGRGRSLAHDLKSLGVENPKKVQLSGFVQMPTDGLYEIQIGASSPVRLTIDEEELIGLDAAPPGGRATTAVALSAGWHRVELLTEGEGAGKLWLVIGGARPAAAPRHGDLAHRVVDRDRATTPKSATPESTTPGDGEARLDLIDAKRSGDGVAIPGEGVVLEWKRSERNLEGLVLWPFRGRNAPPCPGEWVIETRSSSRSRWKPVKNVRFVLCPGPEAPAKGKDPIHLFVEVLFDKVTARQVRIRAADGAPTRLVEIEAQVKAKRRR